MLTLALLSSLWQPAFAADGFTLPSLRVEVPERVAAGETVEIRVLGVAASSGQANYLGPSGQWVSLDLVPGAGSEPTLAASFTMPALAEPGTWPLAYLALATPEGWLPFEPSLLGADLTVVNEGPYDAVPPQVSAVEVLPNEVGAGEAIEFVLTASDQSGLSSARLLVGSGPEASDSFVVPLSLGTDGRLRTRLPAPFVAAPTWGVWAYEVYDGAFNYAYRALDEPTGPVVAPASASLPAGLLGYLAPPTDDPADAANERLAAASDPAWVAGLSPGVWLRRDIAYLERLVSRGVDAAGNELEAVSGPKAAIAGQLRWIADEIERERSATGEAPPMYGRAATSRLTALSVAASLRLLALAQFARPSGAAGFDVWGAAPRPSPGSAFGQLLEEVGSGERLSELVDREVQAANLAAGAEGEGLPPGGDDGRTEGGDTLDGPAEGAETPPVAEDLDVRAPEPDATAIPRAEEAFGSFLADALRAAGVSSAIFQAAHQPADSEVPDLLPDGAIWLDSADHGPADHDLSGAEITAPATIGDPLTGLASTLGQVGGHVAEAFLGEAGLGPDYSAYTSLRPEAADPAAAFQRDFAAMMLGRLGYDPETAGLGKASPRDAAVFNYLSGLLTRAPRPALEVADGRELLVTSEAPFDLTGRWLAGGSVLVRVTSGAQLNVLGRTVGFLSDASSETTLSAGADGRFRARLTELTAFVPARVEVEGRDAQGRTIAAQSVYVLWAPSVSEVSAELGASEPAHADATSALLPLQVDVPDLANFSPLPVTVRTEPGATVWVNAVRGQADAGGAFTAFISLGPTGSTTSIEVTAAAGGRVGWLNRVVERTDALMAPVSSPSVGLRLDVPPGARVRVSGREIMADGAPASVELPVLPGSQMARISLLPAAGGAPARVLWLRLVRSPAGQTVRVRAGQVEVDSGTGPTTLGPARRESGRSLLPLRAVLEALGADVSWEYGAVAVALEGSQIAWRPGEAAAMVNGEARALTGMWRSADGRLWVDAALLAELVGGTAEEDGTVFRR